MSGFYGMTNYTPLDISLLLREGGGGALFSPKKRDGFDRIFFPFALLILIMSISFYAVKQAISIFNQNESSVVTPTESPRAVITQFAPLVSPTPTTLMVYQDLNGILVDSERMLATAEAQYPNLSKQELVELVNKSLVEWAALRVFYADNESVKKELTLQTDYPLATFGAVLREVGVMVKEHDSNTGEEKKPSIDALIEAFTANSSIR